MPTYGQEKVVASRSWPAYLIENTGLLIWLFKSYVLNKINGSLVQALLRNNGADPNFIELIKEMSDEAIKKQEDVQRHLTILGARAVSIQVVVKSSSITEAYNLPLRDHFLLPSALLDGYGSYSFIHKPAGFFEEDKKTFKNALFQGKETLISKIADYLSTIMEQDEVWENVPVADVVRRMVITVFSETYLGIAKEDILRVYEPLTQSLELFEYMWQNPDQFSPWTMFMLFQQLEQISNELHKNRAAAELPDDFARRYKRPLNMAAIFLVASTNLVDFITAAILHQCTNPICPERADRKLEDLAKEVATWRFRNSRIYRFDAGLLSSNAPNYSVGGQVSLPRSITIIPQGQMNHHRLKTDTLLNEDGHVKDPELFGRGRPCPGSAVSYAAVKSVFFAVGKKGLMFQPRASEQEAYNEFVEGGCCKLEDGSPGEPPVTGRWVSQPGI